VAYTVDGNKLAAKLKDGSTTGLADEKQFVGYQGDAAAPSSLLLRNNGIHIDMVG
jgi:malate synthase